MKSKIELLFRPGEIAAKTIEGLGSYSIEAAKALVRRQIGLGQATLRLLDPHELVTHRYLEMGTEKTRRTEVKKLGKELRERDSTHPEYSTLVRFNTQSMLKVVDQWAADGKPISTDARNIAEKFLKENKVPDEIIFASLDQLQAEKPVKVVSQEISGPANDIEVYSPL